MHRPLLASAAALAACVALCAPLTAQQLVPPSGGPLPPPPDARGQVPPQGAAVDADEGDGPAEVLIRGPVHEAFAEPVTFNPKPGFIAPRQPPELVEELPPDQKPEGDNVAWISGYWSWDDDRKDFIRKDDDRPRFSPGGGGGGGPQSRRQSPGSSDNGPRRKR